MEKLEPPHSHSLSAADGWLELGNIAEARTELDRIPARLQNHPQVLEVRWTILAHEKNWPAALQTALDLLRADTGIFSGWLYHAYALRRAPGGGLQAAWDALLPALEKFPRNATIPYNLACYACQLRRLDEARALFQTAIKAGGREQIKRLALQDADLEPLWAEIGEL